MNYKREIDKTGAPSLTEIFWFLLELKMRNRFCSILISISLLIPVIAVSGCNGNFQEAGENPTLEETWRRDDGQLFGDITIGGVDKRENDTGPSGIGVNSFLWRASLDTLSFLPLASADPFGGVIITDWYAPPESPGERFKVTVYLLGRQLRSDGLRVSVFRQSQAANGNWIDSALADDTATKMADAILTRARELRIASSSG
jgi:hypothetical protein